MITIKKILCPTDFSETSRNALRYAKEFAMAMNAKLILLHVVEPIAATAETVPFISEAELEKTAREELDTLIRKDCPPSMAVSTLIKVGLSSDVILSAIKSEDIDLVVMGSHGRTGLTRLLLGSVTEAVMRRASCPMLIVKEHEKEFVS